jgi:hypothetical protein
MNNLLARTSLHILPLCFLLGCGPTDLTVADKNPIDSGAAGSSALPADKTPADKTPADKTPEDVPPPLKPDPNDKNAAGAAGAPTEPAEPTFFCSDLKKTNIPSSLVCDGMKDCPDGSDEINCPAPPFVCKDGTKIDASSVCSGMKDCLDGSDEESCPPAPFVCKNGSKLDPSLLCDGKDECGDGSDELNCGDVCKAGVDQAPRLDPIQKCLLPQEAIGCAALIEPSAAVPKKWPDVSCLVRKKDGAVFLVPEPQLAADWDECTSSQLTLASLAEPCP